jgi:hypothetical protein
MIFRITHQIFHWQPVIQYTLNHLKDKNFLKDNGICLLLWNSDWLTLGIVGKSFIISPVTLKYVRFWTIIVWPSYLKTTGWEVKQLKTKMS